MRSYLLLLCLCAGIGASAQTVLSTDWTAADTAGWKIPPCAVLKQDSAQGSYVEITLSEKDQQGDSRLVLPFDFSAYAGKTLRMTAEMSYDGISKPARRYNGTKFMMVYRTSSGGRYWRHPMGQYGSSPWKRIAHAVTIHADALPGTIELGIQDAVGTVRFRKLRLDVIDLKKIFPRLTPPDYRCEYTPRVLNEPIRRGMMSTGTFNDAVTARDLPDLKAWGANLYRWQLIRNWHKLNDNQDRGEYLAWIRSKLPGTRKVLDRAHELGIRVVLDLHVAPGGRRQDGYMNMFENPEFAETFLEAWRILAGAFKGHPALFGYDLINEPHQPAEELFCDYLTLQYRAACEVRKIDPDTPIIIEANDWDAASSFDILSPLPLKDIIYQAHMYHPAAYTHQGVQDKPHGGKHVYPNPELGYTKESIRRYVQAARDFQLKHGARIYVGEFSAARWAKGAETFLADAISIFEEYGWDWSYHAFRESKTWSVEHTEDKENPQPAVTDTPRKKALLEGFRNNR